MVKENPIHKQQIDPVPMADPTLGAGGSNQPHPNRQPYLALSFIIALQGIYPPRP